MTTVVDQIIANSFRRFEKNMKGQCQNIDKRRLRYCRSDECQNKAEKGGCYCKVCLGFCNVKDCYYYCFEYQGTCAQHSLLCIICHEDVEEEGDKFCRICSGSKEFIFDDHEIRKIRAGLCLSECCNNKATKGACSCKKCLELCKVDGCYYHHLEGFDTCPRHSGYCMVEGCNSAVKEGCNFCNKCMGLCNVDNCNRRTYFCSKTCKRHSRFRTKM